MFKVSASFYDAYILAVGYEKGLDSPCHRSFQIISSLMRRSSIVYGLLPSSLCLRDCKIVMLTYLFNSETCRRRYLTDAMVIFQQDGAPAHRACNARLVTRHSNYFIAKHELPPNSPDLNLLAWLSCVECHAESQSQTEQVSHEQLRKLVTWSDTDRL